MSKPGWNTTYLEVGDVICLKDGVFSEPTKATRYNLDTTPRLNFMGANAQNLKPEFSKVAAGRYVVEQVLDRIDETAWENQQYTVSTIFVRKLGPKDTYDEKKPLLKFQQGESIAQHNLNKPEIVGKRKKTFIPI